MVRIKWFVACALGFTPACDGGDKAGQEGGSTREPGVEQLRDAHDEDADNGELEPAPAGKSFAAVAEQACKLAGGECLTGAHLTDGNVLVAGINCRPGQPGLFCIRAGGPCEGYEEQRCCARDDLTGKFVPQGRVSCDRGHPVCLNVDTWRASSKATCTTPLPASAPADAPNLWQGAIGVEAVARWACEEVGGEQIEREAFAAAVKRGAYDALCDDGYAVDFSDFGLCCVPKSACPEDDGIECCRADGTVDAKFCHDGRAGCSTVQLAFGKVREVRTGGCHSF